MSCKGVIFDLDGVLVDTVPLHFAAWKRMFNEYGYDLDERLYRQKVDGLPRQDGVRNVMADTDENTRNEAGKRKQAYYLEMIDQGMLKPFVASINFCRELRQHGVLLAAASSSHNAPTILEKIGVLDDFTAVVTAADVARGKPHPDIFLAAAQRLALPVAECAVIEDAQSGVRAAKEGGFICIGIDRHSQPQYFTEADTVVRDLQELDYFSLNRLFEQ